MADQTDDLSVEDRDRRRRQDERADKIAQTISGAEWIGRVRAIGAHKGYRCGRCLEPLPYKGFRCGCG